MKFPATYILNMFSATEAALFHICDIYLDFLPCADSL